MPRIVAASTFALIALLSGACGSKASPPSASAAAAADPCSSVKAAQTALRAKDLVTARSDLAAALRLAQQQDDGKLSAAIGNDVKLVAGAQPNPAALTSGDPLLNDCGF